MTHKGSVSALVVAQTYKHLRFVDSEPVGHSVGQLVNYDLGVLLKPLGRLIVEPAAFSVKSVGIILVEKGNKGSDACG